jgi:hypothetical protein
MSPLVKQKSRWIGAWHSFGAVNPYSVVKTEFQLTNLSDRPVRIERIGTSCGCATVPEIGTRTLLPRSSLKLPVSLHTDGRSAIAQQVYIIFASGIDAEQKITAPLTLNLYAWQPQSMEVSPSHLDFGPISRSRIAESVIRLTESPVDRFQLQASDFAGLPIRESVEKKEQEGLASYLVRLRLDPSGLRTGEHAATIQIKTSSRFRPVVKIPVHFTVASEIKARPAVVEFAPASKESALAPIAVTLQHTTMAKLLHVDVLEAPDGVRAAVEADGTKMIVKVSVVPARESKTGVVKMRACWDGGQEILEIPFYYFPPLEPNSCLAFDLCEFGRRRDRKRRICNDGDSQFPPKISRWARSCFPWHGCLGVASLGESPALGRRSQSGGADQGG